MAYNPYGAPPYGPPPAYGGFPGSSPAPGMAPPPGLGPPPGMSSAPGMAPPPGVQQANAAQANRPSGLPPNFQANMPNINFNAPVIRLGTLLPKSSPTTSGRRESDSPLPGGGRPGLGMDRGGEQSRTATREAFMQSLIPPTNEEKLRTVFISNIPAGLATSSSGMGLILDAVGKLKRWESSQSVLPDREGLKFGFAQFEDVESLDTAVELLKDLEVPLKLRKPAAEAEPEKPAETEKVKLRVTVDPSSTKYLDSYRISRDDDSATTRLMTAKKALEGALEELSSPQTAPIADGDGDMTMGSSTEPADNVEVVNIPLAQDDELADIPAEMREIVAKEIAAFRDRSNQRDMERLQREEEMEEMERQSEGAHRHSRLASPPPANANTVPLGPRGVPNAPSGPRGGQNGTGRGPSFVNGGISNAELSISRTDEDSDVSDDELHRRELARQRAEDDKLYLEAERRWVNRERSRAAALDRERDRDKQETESLERRRQEQLDREKSWDDERESSRKAHPYYRDHGAWVRKRVIEKADEEARDEADRKAEEEERRRREADMEQARGLADSFLDRQAQETEQRQQAAAPQPFKLSFGAAAQRAQAQRAAPQRRTVAEVEGLLDDEENEQTTRRQLIPIQFEPMSSTSAMSEEEITKAVRALAQEIPSEKEGLWGWEVQWDYMDDSIVREKLRPFVEKKIMEYLGVQEQMLVEVVEDHLRKHGKPSELVDELSEAMDDEAEDLVKKLWRMVIFFTESEKRGLPA